MKAREISIVLFDKLSPVTSKVNIAGSIRRKKMEVKDIKIICLPVMQATDHADLFGSTETIFSVHHQFITTVMDLGRVIKGNPTGRYMQIELKEGINLDLFMPQPADYYRQYAIRTGSSNYSEFFIARGWKRLGWVGTKDGLRRKEQCKEKQLGDGKTTWVCIVDNPTLPPCWQSEQEFFKWLEVPYLDPVNRNM